MKINTIRDEEQIKALEIIKQNDFRGIVDLPLRLGKSRIAMMAIQELYTENNEIKILWVTDSAKLRDVDLPNDFRNFDYDYLLDNVEILCYGSLPKYMGNYDAIILDEFQNLTSLNSRNLIDGTLFSDKILCFSGTYPKSYEKQYILAVLNLKVIHSMSIDDAVSKKIISDYEVKVVYFNLTSQENIAVRKLTETIDSASSSIKDKKESAKIRKNIIYRSNARLDAIKKIKNTLHGRRGILFVSTKSSAEILGPYYHSTSDNQDYEDFQAENINHIHMVKSGSVGHTYKNIDFIVVGQVTTDLNGLSTQSWGRGLLYEEGKKLTVYILCARRTIEEKWVEKALERIDSSNVSYYDIRKLIE